MQIGGLNGALKRLNTVLFMAINAFKLHVER
jgi:hypothetical protein